MRGAVVTSRSKMRRIQSAPVEERKKKEQEDGREVQSKKMESEPKPFCRMVLSNESLRVESLVPPIRMRVEWELKGNGSVQ